MNPNHLTIAKHHFLIGLICKVKECRTAQYNFEVESRLYHALGQIYAALSLEAIERKHYDRLSDMALNAAALRREELLLTQPVHSRIALQAYLQAKAAKKQVAA